MHSLTTFGCSLGDIWDEEVQKLICWHPGCVRTIVQTADRRLWLSLDTPKGTMWHPQTEPPGHTMLQTLKSSQYSKARYTKGHSAFILTLTWTFLWICGVSKPRWVGNVYKNSQTVKNYYKSAEVFCRHLVPIDYWCGRICFSSPQSVITIIKDSQIFLHLMRKILLNIYLQVILKSTENLMYHVEVIVLPHAETSLNRNIQHCWCVWKTIFQIFQ